MSRQSSNSFLPSGGIDFAGKSFSHLSSQIISPLSGVPRSLPTSDFFSVTNTTSQRTTPSPKAHMRSPPHQAHGQPLSPPKTRSPSAENTSATLVEDWRAYTAKLRSQNEGERAHMIADRAMMEDVMAEERQLWDLERSLMKARIAELEAQLAELIGSPVVSPRSSVKGAAGAPQQSVTGTRSNATSGSSVNEASSTYPVPQESGRDADGKPYYAPAPRNPSRTFEPLQMSTMALGSLPAPKESTTRASSKDFTPSDFVRSPPTDLDSIPENLPETIDISQIRPELEGVSLKASALTSPTFAPKATSPRYSPNRVSPSAKPPPRDITNLSRSSSKSGNKERREDMLPVASVPENQRLTMHAGHTPNHSISKIPWISNEELGSGNETPRAGHIEHLHRPSVAPGTGLASAAIPDMDDDGDAELSGPLGLTNEAANDDPFLAALDEKLEQAKKSQPTSPSETSSCSSFQIVNPDSGAAAEDDKDEGPTLRLKPSLNFGRPMGRW